MELPIYEAIITDENDGIMKISLVDEPAVESDFVAFNKDKKFYQYALENEEQRMILGVVMRADFNIYRYEENLGEYYIRYSKDTIKKMAQKLMKDGLQNCVNRMHLDNSDVEGVEMVQLFIKDVENGINPKQFEDLEDGSLFAQFKVENDEIWQQIKDGTFKGFSLEGYFTIEKAQYKKIKNKNSNMNKVKELLQSLLVAMGEIETDKGTLTYDSEDNEIAVGDKVTIEDAVAEDGDYIAEDGKTITVADGVVADIKEVDDATETEEEVVEEMAEETVEETTEETVEETPNEIDELKAEIETLKGEIETIKSTLKDVLEKPIAEPIAEEFSKVDAPKNDKFSRMAKRASLI